MNGPAWQLEKHVGHLHLDRLHAAADLTRPADGLAEIRVEMAALSGTHLLAIVGPALSASEPGLILDQYVRGDDLVAAYRDAAHRPIRVEALWRAARPQAADGFLAAVELWVSAYTPLPVSRPELAVESSLAASEALRLTDADRAQCVASEPPQSEPVVMRPGEGAGCVLFRLPPAELSYAEMVHPLDFQHDELSSGSAGAQMMVLRHRLFPEELEKGVILRARVRGVFLPRADDLRLAAECYRAFAATEPPLGT